MVWPPPRRRRDGIPAVRIGSLRHHPTVRAARRQRSPAPRPAAARGTSDTSATRPSAGPSHRARPPCASVTPTN